MQTAASDVQFGVLNHLSKIPGGLQGGTPLVLFDKNTRDTIVISPSSNFMDTNQATWTTSKGERVIGFGPLQSIKTVYICYTHHVFCYYVMYVEFNIACGDLCSVSQCNCTIKFDDSFSLSCQLGPYKGYFETALVVGNGIVDTIQEWGKVINVFNSRDARFSDFSINYLG